MAGLSVEASRALAQVIDAVPDEALNVILSVVRASAGQRAREVEALLHDLVDDRRRRQEAFGAVAPMFRRRQDGLEALTFPPTALPRLWRGASTRDPEALVHLDRISDDQATFRAMGRRRLYDAAVAILDAEPERIWPRGPDADEAAWRRGVAELRGCCVLGVLANRHAPNVASWAVRPNEDQQAELKLALRDAADTDPEGPRRLVDILVAHLGQTGDVVWLAVNAAAASGHGAMLHHSELSLYIGRALSVLEALAQRIAEWRPGASREALERDLKATADIVSALELSSAIEPQSACARRLAGAKAKIAGSIERQLQAAAKAVARILPTREVQMAGRMTRRAADPDVQPPEEALNAARGLADLVGAVRSAASRFGCEARRQAVTEQAAGDIVQHIEQLVEAIHAGDVGAPRAATERLSFLADLLERLGDHSEARTARRRITALAQAYNVRAA